MTLDPVLHQLTTWATAQPDIRAMLLTSTRAISNAPTDQYSDYDIILITTDVAGRHNDHTWQHTFGEVVISYHDPLEPDPASGEATSGSIVYYPGTLKIDFTLWSPAQAAWIAAQPMLPTELDAGYRLLLDKDALTAGWPIATGTGYRIQLPDRDAYLTLVNDFFIGVPYVVTALIRGELLPAKWVLDYDMRYVYLLPMLEWYASANHPNPRIGVHGKGLHRYLPQEMWAQLHATYAGMDPAANCAALHAMIELFRDAAIAVSAAIGAEYPQPLHDRVMRHVTNLSDA